MKVKYYFLLEKKKISNINKESVEHLHGLLKLQSLENFDRKTSFQGLVENKKNEENKNEENKNEDNKNKENNNNNSFSDDSDNEGETGNKISLYENYLFEINSEGEMKSNWVKLIKILIIMKIIYMIMIIMRKKEAIMTKIIMKKERKITTIYLKKENKIKIIKT